MPIEHVGDHVIRSSLALARLALRVQGGFASAMAEGVRIAKQKRGQRVGQGIVSCLHGRRTR